MNKEKLVEDLVEICRHLDFAQQNNLLDDDTTHHYITSIQMIIEQYYNTKYPLTDQSQLKLPL